MNSGVQIMDASGKLVFSTQDRMGRIISTFDTGTDPGSRTMPVDMGTGDLFVFSVPKDGNINPQGLNAYPDFTISGRTVSWIFLDFRSSANGPFVPRLDCNVFVGVF